MSMTDTEKIQILTKCKMCENHEKIKGLEMRMKDGEERLEEGDKKFLALERSLRANNKTTNEVLLQVTSISEMMYRDTPDRQSLQTVMALTSSRLNYIWGFMIFIIVSLTGIAFSLIQKNLESTTPHNQQVPYIRTEDQKPRK
jgi:hypothetical protein